MIRYLIMNRLAFWLSGLGVRLRAAQVEMAWPTDAATKSTPE